MTMVKMQLYFFCICATILMTISPYCQGRKSTKSIELFKNHNQTFDRKLQAVYLSVDDPANHLKGTGRLEDVTEEKPLDYWTSGSDHAQAVTIQIENYSNKILGDGQYHISAGWEWPDKKPNSVGPGAKDVLIYSDNNFIGRSCGGSVSWQIKEDMNGDEGGKYRTKQNKGARIAFSWYITEGDCGAKIYTKMQLEINDRISTNEKGDWKKPDQKSIYNKHYYEWGKSYTTKEHHYEAKHSRRISLKQLAPKFEARVIVTNGCKPTVRIQVLGIDPPSRKHSGTKLITEEAKAGAGIPEAFEALMGGKEEGTPLMSILVMAGVGVAGVVLAVILLKTSIAIHKKRQNKKKHGDTEYRSVSDKDEDED